MNAKHVFAILIGVAIIAIFLGTRTEEPKTLKVGVLTPLTGNFAVIGERVRNGFELAREDIKQKDGLNITMVYEDACQPKEAVSATMKMIKQDNITLLGGSFCVAGFVPALKILEQHKMIAFNLAPNPDVVLGSKYLISTNTSIQQKATELGQFAAERLHAKTAAIIYYSTPLGEDYRRYFTRAFETVGGHVLASEMTLIDASDFRTELAKVKALNPDLIFVVQLAKPLGVLLTQARELHIDAKILGNSQNEDPSIIAQAGAAAEGFLISSDEPAGNSTVTDFNQRYQTRFGQSADVFSRNAYDALHLQALAYQKCGSDSDCMLTYLHTIKNYEGVSGAITIQLDGTALKATSFKIVRDGKFVSYSLAQQ